MTDEAPTLRHPGRLSREDQRRVGDALKRVYQDIVRQGFPDRFKGLLNKFAPPNGKLDVEVSPPEIDHQKASSA